MSIAQEMKEVFLSFGFTEQSVGKDQTLFLKYKNCY